MSSPVTVRPEIVDVEEARTRGLDALWETGPGLKGWLSSVDHKELGLRYIVTAFAFLILGGLEALVMRLQLARPEQHLISPGAYNELFSTHGMTMIFLYSFPILSGFSIYLWPLMLGTRDMAFPRANAFSYWAFLASGLFMYAGVALGYGPNDGWFSYVPMANRAFNPGPNIDFYSLGMIFFGISTTVGSANFVVTFYRLRCPGMSFDKVPILTWGTLTASAANLLVVPAVSLAFFMLWMDRQVGTHFFDVPQGGQALLWQHLFWIFAHPWVYVIVLPAMGMVSDALPVLCRRPIVGYTPVALSTLATMVLGFGVWVHHMFATGLPNLALSFFSAASMMITLPSAVAVFAWTATIWLGRPVINTAFLFFSSMIVLFVIGGVSGFMTGSVPVDWQLTDTYFIVAHLHYVLIGINVWPVCGALIFWFPKITGRMMDERWGQVSFWSMFAGLNIGFFPMHVLGLLGMPRRVYTYPAHMGWDLLNLVTSLGSYLFALGVAVFLVNVLVSARRGRKAEDNPWGASTLEWSTSSPPPPYNFAVIPQVATRYPLWEEELQGERRSVVDRGMVLDHGKEMLATTALESRPEVVLKVADDSLAPFLLTLGLSAFFTGLLLRSPWLAAAGLGASAVALLVWLWPQTELAQRAEAAADA